MPDTTTKELGIREKANLLRHLLETHRHVEAREFKQFCAEAITFDPYRNLIHCAREAIYQTGPWTIEAVYPAWQCLEWIDEHYGKEMGTNNLELRN